MSTATESYADLDAIHQQDLQAFNDLALLEAKTGKHDAQKLDVVRVRLGWKMEEMKERLGGEVKRLRSRLEACETIAKAEKMAAERAKLEAAIEEADKALEAAQQTRDAMVRPLGFKLRQIDQAEDKAHTARSLLRQTIAPELREQIEAVSASITATERSRKEVQKRIESLKSDIGLYREGRRGIDYTDALAKSERALERAAAELAELQKQEAELLKRRDELEKQSLQP